MAENHDVLEDSLDALGQTQAPPPPPSAFLRAVGRRRTERRIRQASVAVAMLVVGAGVFLALDRSAPSHGDRVIANANPVTVGSYHYYEDEDPRVPTVEVTTPSRHTTYASDWRSETRLAALIGNS